MRHQTVTLSLAVAVCLLAFSPETASPGLANGPPAGGLLSQRPAEISPDAWRRILERIERDGYAVRPGAEVAAQGLGRSAGQVHPMFRETAKIQASDKEAGDQFGSSVAISVDTAIVAADVVDNGGSGTGAAYLFERNQGGANNWGETAKIQASDKEVGDQFGRSVAISGDTAIVGADREATGGAAVGAAYFFEPTPGGSNKGGETAKIQASDKQAGDAFGFSVAISGGTAIVGALAKSTGAVRAGAAYLFERPGDHPGAHRQGRRPGGPGAPGSAAGQGADRRAPARPGEPRCRP